MKTAQGVSRALVLALALNATSALSQETHSATESARPVDTESSGGGVNGISSLSVGGVLANPLGERARIYARKAGIAAEMTFRSDDWLGKEIDLYASAHLQPYDIANLRGVRLVQWTAALGIETRTDAIPLLLKPYLGVGVGWVYSRLSYDKTFSNPAPNEGMSVVAQIKPGVRISLIENLSLFAQSTINIPTAKNRFSTLNGIFGIRWDF